MSPRAHNASFRVPDIKTQ